LPRLAGHLPEGADASLGKESECNRRIHRSSGAGPSRSPGASQADREDCRRHRHLRVVPAHLAAPGDIDEGRSEGLTTEERAELVRLCRENRVLRMEKEILGKAAAFFAGESTYRSR
jgi:transposase-like protein